MIQSPGLTATLPTVNAAFAVWTSTPCAIRPSIASAAFALLCCVAGTTQPNVGPLSAFFIAFRFLIQ